MDNRVNRIIHNRFHVKLLETEKGSIILLKSFDPIGKSDSLAFLKDAYYCRIYLLGVHKKNK